MPANQRAYWSWIGSIKQDPAAALAAGVELLAEHPNLHRLYLRLPEVCLQAGQAEHCRAVLAEAAGPGGLTQLYREVALIQLMDSTQAEAARAGWQQVAGAPLLDPTLARLVVEQAQRDPGGSWLPEVEAIWRAQLSTDSTVAGAAFGLGYAAVLRNEWQEGERLLRQVTRLAPDDPQAFRELGRIYYFTGNLDAFEEALEAGIQAAHARYDMEQELILRGNLGMALMQWRGDYEKAGALFEEALAQSRFLSDGATEGFNLYRLAYVRSNQDRYLEALALLDSAAVRYRTYAPQQYANVLALRGATLSRMFRFSEAEQVLEEAISEAEAQGNIGSQIQSLINLLQLRYEMGQYGAARTIGLEALEMARTYQTTDYEIVARMVLGDVERAWGNFEGAEVHYREGLEIAQQTESIARERELYERLGHWALDIQDANAARTYFDRMIERVDTDASSISLAEAYHGLGLTYLQFENDAEATRLFDLALSHIPADAAGMLEATILRSKAAAVAGMGSFGEAVELLEASRRLTPDDRNSLYRTAVGLGNIYLEQGAYREALAHFQKAEAVEDELQWTSMHWDVLHGKAVAFWHLGRLKDAEQAFREAVSVIETLRDNFNSPEDRSFFVQNKVQVYKNFSAFLEEQGRSEEAFYYNERARSRSLVDLLYTTQQGARMEPGSTLDHAIEMNRRVRALEKEIVDEALSPRVQGDAAAYRANRAAYLRRERLRADSLYRQVEINLYGEHQIFTFNPLHADSVQAILHEGEAIVVYNLRQLFGSADARAASVAYIVLPDTIIVRPLAVDEQELAETIRFFRDQISNSNHGPGTGWEPAAQRLYQDLISPVRAVLPASIRHLHIVPEGVMHYLPFAALQDADGRFLVEDFTLSVVPSATILKLCRERNPGRWSYMLLLADPDGRLPGARKEVLSIASGAANRRHVLVGKEATQPTFTEVADNYDVIHLATHGNFISRAPWRSHLELYGDVLSVEEIGHLRLDAYLVTLSACETALSGGLVSDVPNGDEWVGLNQAFLAAGTPTVMASLWSIDDRASSAFMIGFYDRLGPGGKAHALAEMQRQFIRNERTRHPFYWAAFTVIGDPL